MFGKRRQLSVETLEIRRVLAASLGWDGPGTGAADLTYYVGNAPASLGQQQFDSAVETALAAWSEVVDVNFTKTTQSGLRDSLDFSFASLDGRGGTLAQAYFPDDVNPARIAGDVQFDVAERWEVGNRLGNSAFDLVSVAVHEIGHALGLDHLSEAGSVLFPSISPNQSFAGLSQDDISAIRQLYAAETVNSRSETPTTTDDGIEDTATDTAPAEDTRQGFRNPWNRFRWSWRISFRGFNFRGFGRIDAEVMVGHNLYNPTDVNDDSLTSALDALLVINTINTNGQSDLNFKCDTNNDGVVSAMDVLTVINKLNNANETQTINAPELSRPTEPDNIPKSEMEELDTPVRELEERFAGTFRDLGIGLGYRGQILRTSALDSLFENFDVDGNGLTEQELPKFAWDLLIRSDVDSDADGMVTREEADLAIDNQLMQIFQALDEDGDGGLTQAELPERVWERVVRADEDEDGAVSFTELREYQALTPFERLDHDGDGEITESEVSERAWRRLSRFDDDGDSAISSDELPEPAFESRIPKLVSRLGNLASRLFRVFGR